MTFVKPLLIGFVISCLDHYNVIANTSAVASSTGVNSRKITASGMNLMGKGENKMISASSLDVHKDVDRSIVRKLQAVNDECIAATILQLGETVRDSTVDATRDNVGLCGTSNTSPGVWFTVTGIDGSLMASTCSFPFMDTKISVFTGSSCDDLVCVDGNDDSCGLLSEVTWESTAGQQYYILVHAFASATGEFEITVVDPFATESPVTSLPEPTFRTPVPEPTSVPESSVPTLLSTTVPVATMSPTSLSNDVCGGAMSIEFNTPIQDSTAAATFSDTPDCAVETTAPGVWFSVVGIGSLVVASTCANTAFDTKISIFSGSCDDLICIDGNDDSCNLQSEITWNAEDGQLYYIFVHGFSTLTGDFELLVEERVVLANDFCDGAVPVTSGVPFQDSTIDATVDEVGECAVTVTSPGVWFSMVGTGNAIVASTCSAPSFDTKISVFSGSCEALECVDGNDDFCDFQSEVSWNSESDVMYYILIHGFASEVGEFEVIVNASTITGPPPTDAPDIPEIPLNDLCEGAVDVAIGVPVQGSTSLATLDGVGTCGTVNFAPGVWFAVTGTGDLLSANTCEFASYDTKISVFTGSCDELLCVDGNDDACETRSEVLWVSIPGERYLILVHGFSDLTGDFELNVEESTVTLPPGTILPTVEPTESTPALVQANDVCDGAVSMTPGVPVQGSTSSATVDNLETCGGAIITAPGVWFSITGTGGILLASTCSLESYDTKISVFSGSCSDPVCVDGNDDFCGVQSEVVWDSLLDESYFILVHGFSALTGDFELVVESNFTSLPPTDDTTPVPTGAAPTLAPIGIGDNDVCGSAAIVPFGVPIPGSTSNATPDVVEGGFCGVSITAPGVWYSVTGTGNTLQASTCGGVDSYDTKISVFSGSCSDFICVGGNDDSCGVQSEIVWDSLLGEAYLVLVHGFQTITGDFQLTLQEIGVEGSPTESPDLPPDTSNNDFCVGAVNITLGVPLQDSTVSATFDGVESCGTTNNAPGVWFTVSGTGGELQASTCSFASFDTKISVFTGTCDNLVCVDGNDDLCGLQSQVNWNSLSTENYYILVHGFGDSSGDFGLAVDQVGVDLPSLGPGTGEVRLNDLCEGAIDISVGEPIQDSTNSATFDDVGTCGISNTGPGVWFALSGTDSTLRASTCAGTVFDTKLTVYTGSCDELICIDGNDDSCEFQSEVIWDSLSTEVYYILVHGFGDITGDFELRVDVAVQTIVPTEPPDSQVQSNDLCDGATNVTLGVPIFDSTAFATFDGVGTCVEGNTAPGVWFRLTGTGGSIVANTCSFASYDTKISVFVGSCDALICVDGNDDFCGVQSQVTWDSMASEEYYILVHGFGSGSGDFSLSVEDIDLDPPTPSPVATNVTNDVCNGALNVTLGTPITGSTLLADSDDISSCGTAGQSSRGVWYWVMGTGGTIQASTCSFASYDTRISVFTGTCSNLVCFADNDDFCELQSEIGWESLPDEQYYILVHGFGNEVGDFELSVDALGTLPPTTLSPQVPDGDLSNDFCEDAQVVVIGVPAAGSTISATVDGVNSCGVTSPGVWFTVTGTGNTLRADTCTFASYDTRISIFNGTCDALACIQWNDDACGVQSEITWDSLPGQEYLILVHGFFTETGTFELSVNEIGVVDDAESFDTCDGAVQLILDPELGVSLSGSTVNATVDGVFCGPNNTAPGVWFSVDGTGGTLQASTCSSASYDTRLSVFSGSCSDLDCLVFNDDFCGVRSQVTWNSSSTDRYYILVHGFGESAGDFTLSLEETVPALSTLEPTELPNVTLLPNLTDVVDEVVTPTETQVPILSGNNDFCNEAVSVTLGVPYSGSTLSATVDELGFCGTSISSPGVWFTLSGTNSTIMASTCSLPAYDTKITVFVGSCDNLECVDGNDDTCDVQSEVSWESLTTEVYFILVHGFGSLTGDFELIVEETGPSQTPAPSLPETQISNDVCDDAFDVILGVPIQGSTISATFDAVGRCDVSNTGPGAWFTVIGTGSELRASTCSFATFDTKISVFSASCDDLVCEGGSDDFCAFQSEVTWDSVSGVAYYILVHGFGTSAGEFELVVDVSTAVTVAPTAAPSQVPAPTAPATIPVNDRCEEAITITSGESLQGSTVGATFDNVGRCGGFNTAPGVWYTVPGTGGALLASTCSFASFDTKLSIFSGSCGDLTCVAGADDSCGLQSAVVWDSSVDEVYYILIHGFSESTGDFQLTVEDTSATLVTAPPTTFSNDQCEDAVTLESGALYQGSTVGATIDNVAACAGVFHSAPGVWFSVEGTGNTFIVNTCEFASFDTQISVYTGQCGNLVCVTGNDDACGLRSAVSWDSALGLTYFILVNGFSGRTGEFALSFKKTSDLPDELPNNECDGALEVELGVQYQGTTNGATANDQLCGVKSPGVGVWFSVIGSGNDMQVSTCSVVASFDTQVSVFTGTCADLVCVTGNDDSCGLQSEVSWASDLGETYFILVHGFLTASGDFDFIVEDVPV